MRPHKLLLFTAVIVLCLFAIGCNSTTGGLGVVASVQVYDTANTAKPSALVRYDGNTLVMWGGAAAQYELFLAADPQLPIYGPFQKKAQGVYTSQRKPIDKAWQTGMDEPLPLAAKALFRQVEVDAWGLSFASYDEGLEDIATPGT